MLVIVFAAAAVLAWLVESMTEFIFGKAVEYYESAARFRPLLAYVAMFFGIGLTVYYRIDLLSAMVDMIRDMGFDGAGFVIQPSLVGYVISGMAVGRGANYINDLISRIRGEVSS